MNYYSIGEAATRLGIPESTIRYYEKQGLLPRMERDEAGRRIFTEDYLVFLKIILYLKNTQMPISQIRQYVDWMAEGTARLHCGLPCFKNISRLYWHKSRS